MIEKIKDIKEVKLAKGHILVELVQPKKSKLIMPEGVAGIPSVIEKEEVILSNFEGINVGDLILDARYGIGERGKLELEGKVYMIAQGHDVKLWTPASNFDQEKESDKTEGFTDLGSNMNEILNNVNNK